MRPLSIALALLLLFEYTSFQAEQITRINEHISYHRVWDSNARTEIGYLKIAQYSTHYSLAVAIGGGIGTLETLERMVGANFAIAGINANFFDKNTKIPIGLLIKDGVVLSTNHGRRAALFIDLLGGVSFVNPSVSIFLKAGETLFNVDYVNRLPKANGLYIFTPEYVLPIKTNGGPAKIFKIRDGRIFSIFEGGLVLPDGISTLVLALGDAKGRLNSLRGGDPVKVIYIIDPPNYLVRGAISAGPMLLKDGEIVLNPKSEGFDSEFVYSKTARSAVALTPQGDLLLLVAIKSRGSAGLNLFELAQFLKRLGVQDAMALDGGGSSAIVFRRGFNLINIGGTRKIAAALVLIPR